MVETLSPLPPINSRVTKPQVAEKNPHHQGGGQQHKDEHKDKEIVDEVIIEANDDSDTTSPQAITKKNLPPNPLHNIDIEV